MKITKIISNIIHPKYTPLNRIEIIKKNILENIAYLQSLQPHAEIFPVLKSNAYGHGLEQMCEILENSDVKMVVVDSFPEAQIVYAYSSKRVLLLGESAPETYKYCNPRRTDFVVYNIDTLKTLVRHFKKPRVHLFVNTGMNREGMQDMEQFLKDAKTFLSKVEIVGLCSHLSSADIDSKLNNLQQKRFFSALDVLHKNNIFPQYVHLGNSAGVFILNDKRLTAFRPGLVIYGYNIFHPDHNKYKKAQKLKPSLRVLSTVVSVQSVKKGEKVSYIETFRAKQDTKIAIIPFGYFEGLDRRLSNIGKVKIHDTYCPIVGTICMNLTCIDVGSLSVKVGDVVEVISEIPKNPNSVESLARLEGTISYEVLVRLQGGVRREIV